MAIADIIRFPAGTNDFLALVRGSAARKAEAALRLRFYRDRQGDATREQLDRLFPGKGRDGWLAPTINLVRKIVDKRAMVYKAAPRRTFEGWDQDRGEALFSSANGKFIAELDALFVFKVTVVADHHDAVADCDPHDGDKADE